MQGSRNHIVCWFGRDCRRRECWFGHPDGRTVDTTAPPRRQGFLSSRSPYRRRSQSRRRSRSRSGVKQRWQSPKRSGNRSASRKSGSRASSKRSRSASPIRRRVLPTPPPPPPGAAVADSDRGAAPAEASGGGSTLEERRRARARVTRGLQELQPTRLFFDMYHPLSTLRRFDLRVLLTQRRATAFAEELEAGAFAGLCLRAAVGGPGLAAARRGAARALAGQGAPHFGLDPDADALLLSAVPLEVSVWDALDSLQDCPGLVDFALEQPAGKSMTRQVRVRFNSSACARVALAALAEAGLAGTAGAARAALLSPSSSLEALILPPEMSHPKRVSRDAELSAQIVCHLDTLTGIPHKTTKGLLSHAGSREENLDLQLLYLRRVHHFCFYAAAWCGDGWELCARSGASLLRHTEEQHSNGTPAEPPAAGEWSAAHESRLESFSAAEPALRHPSVPNCDDEPLRKRCVSIFEESARQLEVGKFQCVHCKKYFKGREYVAKHVVKMHSDLIEAVRREAQTQAARAAFEASPVLPGEERAHAVESGKGRAARGPGRGTRRAASAAAPPRARRGERAHAVDI